MDNQLYIPKRLKVGFHKREDTYSKKLAYVIYYDDKGKLRKEKSWTSWLSYSKDQKDTQQRCLFSFRKKEMNLVEQFPELQKVIEFAMKAHGEQKRIHGGPYWLHPIAVAEIITNRFDITDITVIVAAICHDILEDTKVSYSELVNNFGQEAASIVVELTKPQRDLFDSRSKIERANDIYSKLAKSSEQARIIKVADRIHNIQEMKFTSLDFQEKYIKDTELLIDYLDGTPFLVELREEFEKAKA